MVKKCPQCKSELKKVEFDAGYGVKINSMHCEKCGFNMTEKNRLSKALSELKEHMAKEVKIIGIGAGLGVRLPNHIVQAFNLKKGNDVLLKPEADGVKLVV